MSGNTPCGLFVTFIFYSIVSLLFHHSAAVSGTELQRSPRAVIVYGNSLKTFLLELGSNDKAITEITLPRQILRVQAIAQNPLEMNSIILSDYFQKKIFKFNLSTKTLSILVDKNVKSVAGIDVDIVGNNLYWVDSEKRTLEVMCFRTQTTIVLSQEVNIPRDIILIPNRRELYVSESGGLIIKFSMDGRTRVVVHQKLNALPTSMAYKETSNELFWIDLQNYFIQKANLSNMESTTKVTDVNVAFSIQIFEDRLYWTDERNVLMQHSLLIFSWHYDETYFGNWGQKSADLLFVKFKVVTNYGLDYVSPRLHNLILYHHCSPSSIKQKTPCSHMCLLSEDNFLGTCMCPKEMFLDKLNQTCVSLSYNHTDHAPKVIGVVVFENVVTVILLAFGILVTGCMIPSTVKLIYKRRYDIERVLLRPFRAHHVFDDSSFLMSDLLEADTV